MGDRFAELSETARVHGGKVRSEKNDAAACQRIPRSRAKPERSNWFHFSPITFYFSPFMNSISTPHAPTPAGHYSQGITHGGLVFVAGQLPFDAARPGGLPAGATAQTEQALRNVRAILEAAGSGLDRLLSVTVYVTDIALWPEVNAAYARLLGDHRPTRAVVPVPTLHHGALVEIQAIAAVQ